MVTQKLTLLFPMVMFFLPWILLKTCLSANGIRDSYFDTENTIEDVAHVGIDETFPPEADVPFYPFMELRAVETEREAMDA